MRAITLDQTDDFTIAQPRARGRIRLSSKLRGRVSAIGTLRQSGAYRVLFPRAGNGLEAILINTAGGVTGGDRLSVEATARAGTSLTLTTQAAERAYRAQPSETGRIENLLQAEAGATLQWLPQETILYNGSAIRRRLKIELAADAQLLMVEPVIFGRVAMGERLHNSSFSDKIEVRRAGRLAYLDAIHLNGNVDAQMNRSAIGGGAGAIASVLYVAQDAEARLRNVRSLLPNTGGASLLESDMMVVRILEQDSLLLRRSLLPVLDLLSNKSLPTSWRL